MHSICSGQIFLYLIFPLCHFLFRVPFHVNFSAVNIFLQNFLPSPNNPLEEIEFDLFYSELILHSKFSVANKYKLAFYSEQKLQL